MSVLFNSILSSQHRWRYIYVWISQWIYYNGLSGPVCQACDPGSGQSSWWASVILPVTCFKMIEWQITRKADAAGKVNLTVKAMLWIYCDRRWEGSRSPLSLQRGGKGDQGAEITQTTLRGRTAIIHQFYFCWVLLNIFWMELEFIVRAYKRTLRDRAA